MCSNSHKIVIKNVNNGDRISTDLILIHGYVEQRCGCAKLTIESSTNPSVAHLQLLPSSAEFKYLCPLSAVDETEFRISYCHTSTTLTLRHTPNPCQYSVVPLYVVFRGHDGHFQSPEKMPQSSSPDTACRRIDVILQLVQLVYAEKLSESNLGRRSFRIADSCRQFTSKVPLETALQMSEQELWDVLASEIIQSEGQSRIHHRKYVAILGCTRYEGAADEDYAYATIKSRTRARAAIGGGGLVVFNTGCLYAWPESVGDVVKSFLNCQPVDMQRFADDSNYRRTLGGCFATNLGSLCHELGHTFDLGHTEEGMMGRSFDATEKLFLPLASVQKRILPRRSSPGRSGAGDVVGPRVTRVRSSGTVLRDYMKEKEVNGVYFTRNCLVILANHKWFQSGGLEDGEGEEEGKETVDGQMLWFLSKDRVIGSQYPLKLVELRENGTEMVQHFWELPLEGEEEKEHREFKLPGTAKDCILFAIDQRGHTLKCSI